MKSLLVVALLVVLSVGLVTAHHRHHDVAAGSLVLSPVAAIPVRTVERIHATATPSGSRPHRDLTPRLHWQRLAWCESRGRWRDNTGNGYYGGLQQSAEFWASWGGLRYAARADLATRAEQITVALRAWAVRGAEPWPTCGGAL